MELPYVVKDLSDDVIFIFHSLQRDVLDITRKTRDHLDGYGNMIIEHNLSGKKRRANKYNYFDNGIDEAELFDYINTLCGVFEKYEK